MDSDTLDKIKGVLENLDRRTAAIEILPTQATTVELLGAIEPLASKVDLQAAIEPLASKKEVRAIVHEERERSRRPRVHRPAPCPA